MNVPSDLKYSQSDEWVRVEGDIVKQTLSIDEGAQFDGSVRRAKDISEVTPDLG